MIDYSFYIGETHSVCQDYVLGGMKSIVLSDGCSGSPLTDYGSRIICSASLPLISNVNDLNEFDEKMCILTAVTAAKVLNLPIRCLDATLIIAKENNQKVQSMMFGDGAVVLKMKDGNTFIISAEYKAIIEEVERQVPFYLTYLCDTKSYDIWKNTDVKKSIFIDCIKPNGVKERVNELFNQDGILIPLPNIQFIVSVKDYRIFISCPSSEIEYIGITSDGIFSFHKEKNIPIPVEQILKELLDFKNYNEAFVKRRINKFQKFCQKNEWGNADDVSMGVIHTGEQI